MHFVALSNFHLHRRGYEYLKIRTEATEYLLWKITFATQTPFPFQSLLPSPSTTQSQVLCVLRRLLRPPLEVVDVSHREASEDRRVDAVKTVDLDHDTISESRYGAGEMCMNAASAAEVVRERSRAKAILRQVVAALSKSEVRRIDQTLPRANLRADGAITLRGAFVQ